MPHYFEIIFVKEQRLFDKNQVAILAKKMVESDEPNFEIKAPTGYRVLQVTEILKAEKIQRPPSNLKIEPKN